MTVSEAQRICRDYYDLTNPSEEDTFLLTEALAFLIDETDETRYMVDLGAIYYEQRSFDLALKYFDMAAQRGDVTALSNLGYIWYYGRTGARDYRKAFECFSRAADLGDLVARYKVADMYENGYYVPKDPEKYKSIIEELYPIVRRTRSPNDPKPEICTRLARIRAEEGCVDEALRLYDEARPVLEKRIQDRPFFGDLNIMKSLIEDVYRLRPFDEAGMGLYDLFEALKKPGLARFTFEGRVHEAEALEEDGAVIIRFDDKWYRTVDIFFQKAELDGELLTSRYEELHDFEVIA